MRRGAMAEQLFSGPAILPGNSAAKIEFVSTSPEGREITV